MDHDESRQLVRDHIGRWIPRGRPRRRGVQAVRQGPAQDIGDLQWPEHAQDTQLPWPRSFRPEKRMIALTRGGLAN